MPLKCAESDTIPNVSEPAPPPQLDYAERPRGVTRRRALRLVTLTVLLIAAVLGGVYLHEIVARFTMLYWQRQCMAYESAVPVTANLPPLNDIFLRKITIPSKCLVEYSPYVPSLPAWKPVKGGSVTLPNEVVMIHERRSPAGNRRLILIDHWASNVSWFETTVIRPGTLFSEPKVTFADESFKLNGTPPDSFTVWLDPADESHFRIDIHTRSGTDQVYGRLDDDGTVGLSYPTCGTVSQPAGDVLQSRIP